MGIEGFDSEYSLDAKKAQRIIISAQEDSDLPELIPGIDNAAVQLQILKEHMLTREYEQAEDSVKQAIQSRSEELMKIAQEEQQKAMAAAQAAKGTDPATSQMVAQSGAMGDAAVPTI